MRDNLQDNDAGAGILSRARNRCVVVRRNWILGAAIRLSALALLAAAAIPAIGADSPAQPLEPGLFFNDGFCCGNLDKWTKWQGEFPLTLFPHQGSLAWKSTEDFETTGGIATGPIPADNYVLRIAMLRWPATRNKVCLYVRASTGEECYAGYRLRIEGDSAWLEKHPGVGGWRDAELTAGPVTVAPDLFHGLWLEVTGSGPVQVRARIWDQAKGENSGHDLEIEDAGSNPIRSGTLGAALWFQVSGQWNEPYPAGDLVSVRAVGP